MRKPHRPKNPQLEHEKYLILAAKIRTEGMPDHDFRRVLANMRAEVFFRDQEWLSKSKPR